MVRFVEPIESYLDGGITQVRIEGGYEDHGELAASVDRAGLQISDLFPELRHDLENPTLALHPSIHHDQRQAARDAVSTEYIPHLDGTCEPIRPTATLVVAREAGENAPATRFFSTTGFLALATELGVFSDVDPRDLDAVFGYSAYYSHTQPYWLELEPNDQRLHEVIQADFAREGVTCRDELVEKLDTDPTRHLRKFPLVSPHTTTGRDAIMFDAGVRNVGLAYKDGQRSTMDQRILDKTLGWLRLLLADVEMLAAEGIVTEITPLTGHGVVFTKETLHNQVPTTSIDALHAKRQISVLCLVPKTT